MRRLFSYCSLLSRFDPHIYSGLGLSDDFIRTVSLSLVSHAVPQVGAQKPGKEETRWSLVLMAGVISKAAST